MSRLVRASVPRTPAVSAGVAAVAAHGTTLLIPSHQTSSAH